MCTRLIYGFLGLPESISRTASRSVQPFCRAHYRDIQTDQQTDHATPCATKDRIYVVLPKIVNGRKLSERQSSWTVWSAENMYTYTLNWNCWNFTYWNLTNVCHAPCLWTKRVRVIVRRMRRSATVNKCSAVAEMGDRLATIDMGRKLGVCGCPFWGSWIPI